MTHYLILADGGCYGNFLACLIRSMWDLNFTKDKEFTKSGACDLISLANSISILINEEYKDLVLYSENAKTADVIVEVLKTKEYIKKMFRYEMNYDHLNTFHYLDKDNVNKFLTVDNVKIIYVVMEPEDSYLIALNKISKNLDISYSEEWVEYVKNNFKDSVKNNIDEYNALINFNTMSNNLKKELVFNYFDGIMKKSLQPLPDTDERILFLKFRDVVNNKDKILKDLSTFIDSEVNETTIDFYQKYLEAQKKAHNYIENDMILICGEGGTSPHFIASLLRTMHDPEFYNNSKGIGKMGVCDGMSNSELLMGYYERNLQIDLMPETELGVDRVYNDLINFNSTILTYINSELARKILNLENTLHSYVIHYIKQSSIEKFLTVPNIKLILIKVDEPDYLQTSINKFLKSFVDNNMEGDTKDRLAPMLKSLLIWNSKMETAESFSKKEWSELTLTEVNDILDSWTVYMQKRMSLIYTGTHNQLLTLNFNDMMSNPEKIMQDIANFTGLTVNDSTKLFYKEYLNKQPTMKTVYNLIGYHE